MGIAHHSVYAVWFEQARTELIARLGWHYRDLEQAGLLLPLAELSARYYKPAFYEDRLLIYTHVSKLTAAQLEFSYEVVRDGGADRRRHHPPRLHRQGPAADQYQEEVPGCVRGDAGTGRRSLK